MDAPVVDSLWCLRIFFFASRPIVLQGPCWVQHLNFYQTELLPFFVFEALSMLFLNWGSFCQGNTSHELTWRRWKWRLFRTLWPAGEGGKSEAKWLLLLDSLWLSIWNYFKWKELIIIYLWRVFSPMRCSLCTLFRTNSSNPNYSWFQDPESSALVKSQPKGKCFEGRSPSVLAAVMAGFSPRLGTSPTQYSMFYP